MQSTHQTQPEPDISYKVLFGTDFQAGKRACIMCLFPGPAIMPT